MAAPQGVHRSGRIIAVDLPGNYLGEQVALSVGIQCGNEVEQIVAADSDEARFEFGLRLVVDDAGIDVRGPYVHGRKGDRFLYLSWGHASDVEPFVRYARTKLKFEDVDRDLLDRLRDDDGYRLVATVKATNRKGTEASGTVRPPTVAWHLDATAP